MTSGPPAFVHSYTRGNDISILGEILERIVASGLATALDALVVVNVGDPVELPQDLELPAATMLINHGTSGAVYEYPTLQHLHLFSRFHLEARVLYLHTKGASHARSHETIQDWRQYLLYQTVDRFRDCWAALGDHQAAGCDLREWPSRHFSGNFWWAAPRISPLPSPLAREAPRGRVVGALGARRPLPPAPRFRPGPLPSAIRRRRTSA